MYSYTGYAINNFMIKEINISYLVRWIGLTFSVFVENNSEFLFHEKNVSEYLFGVEIFNKIPQDEIFKFNRICLCSIRIMEFD